MGAAWKAVEEGRRGKEADRRLLEVTQKIGVTMEKPAIVEVQQ